MLEIIARYLDGCGFVNYDPDGSVGDGNVGLEHLPDKPTTAIGLFSTGGGRSEITTGLARPGVQIYIRGNNIAAARELAKGIFGATDGRYIFPQDFLARVLLLKADTSQPIYLGPDETGRPRYTFTLSTIIDRADNDNEED